MTFVQVFNLENEHLEAIRLWRTRKYGYTLAGADKHLVSEKHI